MGINLVVGCSRHRERMFIYRGHEAEGLAAFFHRHAGHSDDILISHDQSNDGWVSVGGLWEDTEYPDRGA